MERHKHYFRRTEFHFHCRLWRHLERRFYLARSTQRSTAERTVIHCIGRSNIHVVCQYYVSKVLYYNSIFKVLPYKILHNNYVHAKLVWNRHCKQSMMSFGIKVFPNAYLLTAKLFCTSNNLRSEVAYGIKLNHPEVLLRNYLDSDNVSL